MTVRAFTVLLPPCPSAPLPLLLACPPLLRPCPASLPAASVPLPCPPVSFCLPPCRELQEILETMYRLYAWNWFEGGEGYY